MSKCPVLSLCYSQQTLCSTFIADGLHVGPRDDESVDGRATLVEPSLGYLLGTRLCFRDTVGNGSKQALCALCRWLAGQWCHTQRGSET